MGLRDKAREALEKSEDYEQRSEEAQRQEDKSWMAEDAYIQGASEGPSPLDEPLADEEPVEEPPVEASTAQEPAITEPAPDAETGPVPDPASVPDTEIITGDDPVSTEETVQSPAAEEPAPPDRGTAKTRLDLTTLLEIGRDLNSNLDTTSLVDEIIFSCMGQTGACVVSLLLADKGKLRLRAVKGLDKKSLRSVHFDENTPLFEKSNGKNQPLAIDDLGAEKGDREAAKLARLGAQLIAPLVAKDKRIGFLVFGARMDGSAYGKSDKKFVSAITSMAAVALENAQLVTSLKKTNQALDQKLAELSTLYQVSRVINTSEDISEVEDLVIETVTTGFGVKACAILVPNGRGDQLTVATQKGLTPKDVQRFKLPVGSGVGKELMEQEEPFLVKDVDQRKYLLTRFSGGAAARIKTFLFIPLKAASRTVGLLGIFDLKKGGRNEDELKTLFGIIASQISPPLKLSQILTSQNHFGLDPFSPVLATLQTELETAARFEMPVSIAVFQMHNYKRFIAVAGVKAAGKAASALASSLARSICETDKLVRYGKERFVMILPGKDRGEAESLVEGLKAGLNAIREHKVQNVSISVSSLVAMYPDEGEDALSLLNRID